MNLIQAKDLSHSFEHLLYENINLNIGEAQSVAILGVSGSGKSTLINNLSTLLKPDKGIINLNNKEDIYARTNDEILQIRKNDVGIIFQSHYLFRGFSVLENLQVASILTNKQIDINILKKFGIDKLLKQHIGELSGGQQQRLSIARVLMKKPKIIFADEPTGNLDKNTSINVMEVVFDYIKTNNAAMLIATHDTEIANMCDEKYYLKNCTLTRI